jgi:hypothetical protein
VPRTCTVCNHPQRSAIDSALLNGDPYRGVAQRYAASPDAVYRHRDHLPLALVKAQEAAEVARGGDLLAQLRDLQGHALRVLDQAEQSGDLRAAVAAIREARGCVELLAKLVGQLQSSVEVHQTIHFTIPMSDNEPCVIDGEARAVGRGAGIDAAAV